MYHLPLRFSIREEKILINSLILLLLVVNNNHASNARIFGMSNSFLIHPLSPKNMFVKAMRLKRIDV